MSSSLRPLPSPDQSKVVNEFLDCLGYSSPEKVTNALRATTKRIANSPQQLSLIERVQQKSLEFVRQIVAQEWPKSLTPAQMQDIIRFKKTPLGAKTQANAQAIGKLVEYVLTRPNDLKAFHRIDSPYQRNAEALLEVLQLHTLISKLPTESQDSAKALWADEVKKIYNEQELKDLLVFYKTPSGAKFIQEGARIGTLAKQAAIVRNPIIMREIEEEDRLWDIPKA